MRTSFSRECVQENMSNFSFVVVVVIVGVGCEEKELCESAGEFFCTVRRGSRRRDFR